MANSDHLAELRKGVASWNDWQERNTQIQIDLTEANLSMIDLTGVRLSLADLVGAKLIGAKLTGAKLNGADLSGVDLREVDLRGADLREADLRGADLRGANLNEADLSRADLNGADLGEADLRGAHLTLANLREVRLVLANLRGVDLREAKLRKADLSRTDLREAKLTRADLRGADLREAKLMGADLTGTQALATIFTGAKLTRACLEDWNINRATQLDNITCDFVYLRSNERGRCPAHGTFEPGEFARFFKQVLSTIDLVFRSHVNWSAFAEAFKTTTTENQDAKLTIQSIENKEKTVLLVRVRIAPDVDAARIQDRFMQIYQKTCLALEQQNNGPGLSTVDAQILQASGPEDSQRPDLNYLFHFLHYLMTQSSNPPMLNHHPRVNRLSRPRIRWQ